jgi:hypothetical protein
MTKPSLGFTIGGWQGEQAERLIVGVVHPDGIAAKAGLQSGDIITEIDGWPPAQWINAGARVGGVKVAIDRPAGDGLVKVDAVLHFPEEQPEPEPEQPRKRSPRQEEACAAVRPYLISVRDNFKLVRQPVANLHSKGITAHGYEAVAHAA